MDIKDIMIGRANKYNHYQDGDLVIDNNFECERSCKTCIRKHFSYPYTCNDGWPMGNPIWTDRGMTCINWTNDKNCEVD